SCIRRPGYATPRVPPRARATLGIAYTKRPFADRGTGEPAPWRPDRPAASVLRLLARVTAGRAARAVRLVLRHAHVRQRLLEYLLDGRARHRAAVVADGPIRSANADQAHKPRMLDGRAGDVAG